MRKELGRPAGTAWGEEDRWVSRILARFWVWSRWICTSSDLLWNLGLLHKEFEAPQLHMFGEEPVRGRRGEPSRGYKNDAIIPWPSFDRGLSCHMPLLRVCVQWYLKQPLVLSLLLGTLLGTRVSYIFCIGRRVLYHLGHLGSPNMSRVEGNSQRITC